MDDAQQLDLLSIFHFIVGALAALFSLIPVIHLAIGLGILTGTFPDGGDPAPAIVGYLFVAIAAVMIGAGITYAVCTILAGRFLRRREHYTFCLVMAAISCMFAPFGTVLGVFTIIVLSRPSVKQMFSVAAA